ncbi:helix-turn-helix domain-containing protein [Stenotrophobium rhamnosiphilum]|uniref:helix-turn-helix domain-containing protein n=1 Tax=Stenotrophobium rhamnosiphilum TaxID=2029166 RepID=UPI0019D189F0
MEVERAFGQVLREIRLKQAFSQEALALEAGVQRNYVSLLERGLNSASLKIIFKLCHVLDIKPSEVLVMVEQRASKLTRPVRRKR